MKTTESAIMDDKFVKQLIDDFGAEVITSSIEPTKKKEINMSKGGMGNLMKQAQMMQANLKKAQDELANIDIEGSSGNGLVKILMSCKNDIKKVDIDPSLLNDKEMLEDLIIVALKDAFQKIESTSSEKMNGLVPPGMNLPF